MKTIYIIILATIFCLKSTAQIKNYDNSGPIPVMGERTILTLRPTGLPLESTTQSAGLIAVVGTAAPALISLGVKAVQEKIKNAALKYTGTYKASQSADRFYVSERFVSPPTVEIERIVLISDRAVSASKIVLIPELSHDRTAFRFKLDTDSFTYRYSIAKIKPGYNLLDLTVEIKVTSLSVAADEYKQSELRTVLVTIPMVKVNAKTEFKQNIFSGWVPFPKKSSFEMIEVKKDTVPGAKTAPVKGNGTGLYEVEVVVTETNPFKIKAEQRTAFVDSTAESATTLLKAIVEAAIPKPKE